MEQARIEERFGARFAAEFRPRYNAAPSQSLPVILNTDLHTIHCISWGLHPIWMPAARKHKGIINVRVETLRERPTFTRDFVARRCLVLADSFYEWKKEGKVRRPFRITLTSGEPFAFAGIWQENTEKNGQRIKTFALITTAANPLVAQVHDRMPVMLRKEAEQRC